jgi:holliday junction DNA helicase RuvA
LIYFIEGTIEELRDNLAIIDVEGVGYGVHISGATHNAIKGKTSIRLHTYLAVREDAMELYGFADPAEKEVFLLLISINGIGPKNAMSILTNATIEQLKNAIGSGDEAALTRIPGLGAKKAGRLIVELKDKFKAIAGLSGAAGDEGEEYTEALVNLGFKYTEARAAVRDAMKIVKNKEDIIKEALRRLGK